MFVGFILSSFMDHYTVRKIYWS